jgi:hypothetical protein
MGVIYIHRISDRRLTGITKQNFGVFRELCGDEALMNAILVTNMWEEVSLGVGEICEQELIREFFKPVLNKGAQLACHHNTATSAHDIIRRIMRNRLITLQIQRELVDEGKDIYDTAAEEVANRECNEQIRHHQAEFERACEEMSREMQRKNEETRRELEEMHRIQEEVMRQMCQEREWANAEHQRQVNDLTGRLQNSINDHY